MSHDHNTRRQRTEGTWKQRTLSQLRNSFSKRRRGSNTAPLCGGDIRRNVNINTSKTHERNKVTLNSTTYTEQSNTAFAGWPTAT